MSAQESTPLLAPAPSNQRANAHFIAQLLYDNYLANRQQFPEISPERWRKVYSPQLADIMEARYQRQLLRLFTPRKVNEHVRCDAPVDCDRGGKGNGFACGEPTVQCPGCGEESGACEEHLFEQPDGSRVCVECDGKPEFRKMGPDVADRAELAGKVSA
jgi:hypothetical protein